MSTNQSTGNVRQRQNTGAQRFSVEDALEFLRSGLSYTHNAGVRIGLENDFDAGVMTLRLTGIYYYKEPNGTTRFAPIPERQSTFSGVPEPESTPQSTPLLEGTPQGTPQDSNEKSEVLNEVASQVASQVTAE